MSPDGPTGYLLGLFELERIDRDIFRGRNDGEDVGPVFGGQVAAQTLRAAIATVDVDHAVNSMHSYFLRPGRYGQPITFVVDRIRDGRSLDPPGGGDAGGRGDPQPRRLLPRRRGG